MTPTDTTPGESRAFEYLLNAMEHARGERNPAEHGYAKKRAAVFAYVKDLERRALPAATAAAPSAGGGLTDEEELDDLSRRLKVASGSILGKRFHDRGDRRFWHAVAYEVRALARQAEPSAPLAALMCEALEIGADFARGEVARAQELYGQYPPEGLGRRLVSAKRDLQVIEDALAALSAPPQPWEGRRRMQRATGGCGPTGSP